MLILPFREACVSLCSFIKVLNTPSQKNYNIIYNIIYNNITICIALIRISSKRLTIIYAIEVWGCAFQDKYISRFDKFCKHSLRFGYTSKQISFKNIIADRDRLLWNKLNNDPDHCLKDLLPERRRCRSLRNRRHNYILPQVRTERFKCCFINRCLFKF